MLSRLSVGGGRTRPGDVRVGATFKLTRPGAWVETAKVLGIGQDTMGVPHVRFELAVRRTPGDEVCFADLRTLGLESFASRYPELVSA